MDRIAAEISQEINMLLENHHINPCARKQQTQHHSRRAPACNAAAELEACWKLARFHCESTGATERRCGGRARARVFDDAVFCSRKAEFNIAFAAQRQISTDCSCLSARTSCKMISDSTPRHRDTPDTSR